MPTYDYECLNGHRFEVFQKMSDEPVSSCPECDAAAMRKISGGAGFLFKGDGFYITDSRSEDYRKQAAADSGEPAKGSKGESDGSDSSSGSKGDSGGSVSSTPTSDAGSSSSNSSSSKPKGGSGGSTKSES